MSGPVSVLSHLECPKCSAVQSADAVAHLCACGSPLLARYDVERARATLSAEALSQRSWDLWRYAELLPIRDLRRNAVRLGETVTPVVPLPEIGAQIGIASLACKDDGVLPTGSFKARGAAIGVSRARELGVTDFAMPTNGNAGGAWAAYGRRAGMHAHLVMPKRAPSIHRYECAAVGASMTLVEGVIAHAGVRCAEIIKETGAYDASTLKEPYRIEGKKTLGFEIAEQYGWQVPDVILYPTGGGVGLIGIVKAIRELIEIGMMGEKLPRMVAVQSTGCAPIVRAFEAGAHESQFWENAKTVAFGITVPKAIGDFLILQGIYDSGGCAIAVEDSEIVAAGERVGLADGMLLCLEGAATVTAAAQLRANGWIRDGERVLVINTANGLKGV